MFTSKRRTIKVIASTWVVAIVCALPYLHCKSYAFSISSPLGSVSRYICTDRFDDIDEWMYGNTDQESGGRFRKGFFMFLFVTMYIMPSAVILFTCVRIALALGRPVSDILHRSSAIYKVEDNKRKTARMVIVIAVTFLVLWSPFYLVTFISQVQSVSFLKSQNFLFTMLLVHLIGFTNSAVNPFVYALLGDKFRTAFVRLMIDVLSAICCLSYTERGRRIRRQWLTTTGTTFVGGARGTNAYSDKSTMFNNQLELDRRRTEWSNRRSYSSSELFSKQQVKTVTVVDDNRVWNDSRPMSKTSSDVSTDPLQHGTASATLHRMIGATEPGKLNLTDENEHGQTTMIRDDNRDMVGSDVTSGTAKHFTKKTDEVERAVCNESNSMSCATRAVLVVLDADSDQSKQIANTSTTSPSGTDDRRRRRSPSEGDCTGLDEAFPNVRWTSLPELACR